jgi:hypothetical protein
VGLTVGARSGRDAGGRQERKRAAWMLRRECVRTAHMRGGDAGGARAGGHAWGGRAQRVGTQAKASVERRWPTRHARRGRGAAEGTRARCVQSRGHSLLSAGVRRQVGASGVQEDGWGGKQGVVVVAKNCAKSKNVLTCTSVDCPCAPVESALPGVRFLVFALVLCHHSAHTFGLLLGSSRSRSLCGGPYRESVRHA